ncbi:LPS export ABC transporter ATP-binding protein [Acidobacteriota bacterium]
MSKLIAKDLKKSYGRRMVVKGISVYCEPGEILGLLGRNGAGKTTTFQMIVGLVKSDSGSIHLGDLDITRTSTHEKAIHGITYLPQENSVFLKTSVERNIGMILENLKYSKKEKIQRTSELLDELGLTSLANQSAHSLSGGERRRLEICRSLALNPKFLLLDEPFTGIDPITIKELQKILTSLKHRGIGIIISDHNVRDTLKITDRAYIIDEGSILIEGLPEVIAADSLTKEKFLGENFKLGREDQKEISQENIRDPKWESDEPQLSLFEETTGPLESLPEKNKTEKSTPEE